MKHRSASTVAGEEASLEISVRGVIWEKRSVSDLSRSVTMTGPR